MPQPQENGVAGIGGVDAFDAHVLQHAAIDALQRHGGTKSIVDREVVGVDIPEAAIRRRAEFQGAGAGTDPAVGDL